MKISVIYPAFLAQNRAFPGLEKREIKVVLEEPTMQKLDQLCAENGVRRPWGGSAGH